MLSGYKRFSRMELSRQDTELLDGLIVTALRNQRPGEALVIKMLTDEEAKQFTNELSSQRMTKFDAYLYLFVQGIQIGVHEKENQVELRFDKVDEEKLRAHFLSVNDALIPLENDTAIKSHIVNASTTSAAYINGDLHIDALSNEQATAYSERLAQISFPIKEDEDEKRWQSLMNSIHTVRTP